MTQVDIVVDLVFKADGAMAEIEKMARTAEHNWPIVIEGLADLRKRAMRAAQTNDVMSGRYRKTFSEMRSRYPHLAKLKPEEASACCWSAEHPDLYQAALAGLARFHGAPPTPLAVYKRAMRLARVKADAL